MYPGAYLSAKYLKSSFEITVEAVLIRGWRLTFSASSSRLSMITCTFLSTSFILANSDRWPCFTPRTDSSSSLSAKRSDPLLYFSSYIAPLALRYARQLLHVHVRVVRRHHHPQSRIPLAVRLLRLPFILPPSPTFRNRFFVGSPADLSTYLTTSSTVCAASWWYVLYLSQHLCRYVADSLRVQHVEDLLLALVRSLLHLARQRFALRRLHRLRRTHTPSTPSRSSRAVADSRSSSRSCSCRSPAPPVAHSLRHSIPLWTRTRDLRERRSDRPRAPHLPPSWSKTCFADTAAQNSDIATPSTTVKNTLHTTQDIFGNDSPHVGTNTYRNRLNVLQYTKMSTTPKDPQKKSHTSFSHFSRYPTSHTPLCTTSNTFQHLTVHLQLLGTVTNSHRKQHLNVALLFLNTHINSYVLEKRSTTLRFQILLCFTHYLLFFFIQI